MNLEEFGNLIKEKYPQYQNIDSNKLGQRMLEKYPQYQDRIDTDIKQKRTGFLDKILSMSEKTKGVLPYVEKAREFVEPKLETIDKLIPKVGPNPRYAALGLTKMLMPKTLEEVGLTVLFSRLPGKTINYLKNVAPGLIETLPGIGRMGEKALLLRPQKVASLARAGEGAISATELSEFKELQKGVRKVLKDTSSKYGQVESKILGSIGNPMVASDDLSLLAKEADNISEAYRVIPEFQTAKLANPKLSRTLGSVINDILKLATRSKDVSLKEILNLRKQANRIIRQAGDNLALTSAGNRIKEITTGIIDKYLSNEAKELFRANNEQYGNVLNKYNRVKRYLKDPSSVKRIASESLGESNLISDFRDFLGSSQQLDEITATVGARKFAPKAFQGLTSRASFPNILFGPLGLISRIPGANILGRAGVPITPQGVAQFSSNVASGLTSPLAPILSALLGKKTGEYLNR